MANTHTESSPDRGSFRFVDMPLEIRQEAFIASLPDFKVQLLKYQLKDASGNIATKLVARCINKADWRTSVGAQRVSKEMKGFVLSAIAAGVSSGQIAIMPDILQHATGAEPYPPNKEGFYHGTEIQNLEDSFIDDGMLASGETFKHVVMYIPIGLVDISAHEENIQDGQRSHKIIEDQSYDDHDPETLRVAKVVVRKENSGRWAGKVLWYEVATLLPEHEEKNIRRRKLSNGQTEEWDVAIVGFNTRVIEMEAAVENHVQRGLCEILPNHAVLTLQRLSKVQDLVIDSVDGIAEVSPTWTTRSLAGSMQMIYDEQLHSLDFGGFDVEEQVYESRSMLEAKNQKYVRGDEQAASTSHDEDEVDGNDL